MEGSGTVFGSLIDVLEMDMNNTNKLLLESSKACIDIKHSSLLFIVMNFGFIIL